MTRLKLLLLAALLGGALNAHAMPVFVGSYDITDGPVWTTNPAVFSALEAAEIAFGAPVGGFYEISTIGPDPLAINNMGWYDVIGVGPDIFAEDFKKDDGPTVGYNGGGWSSGDDISAWVSDNCVGGGCINFVFFTADAVPEPATVALLGIGMLGAYAGRRRRKA